MGQLQVFFGIDPVQAGAHHRNGVAAAQQRAIMGRTVYAQRQARHHADAGCAKSPGKLARVDFALRRGVAAAHDCEVGWRLLCYCFSSCLRLLCKASQHVQHEGRICDVEQAGRITGIAQVDNAAVIAGVQPLQCRFELGRERVGFAQQGPTEFFGAKLAKSGGALGKNGLGRAKGGQQLSGGFVSYAGRQGEPQPGLEVLVLHLEGFPGAGLA